MGNCYEKPKVVDHGTLSDLTAGTSTGSFLDQSIPAHTPTAAIPGFIATHLS